MRIVKEIVAYILILTLLLRDQFSNWGIWESIPSKPFYIIIIILLIICFYPEKHLSLMKNFWMQLRMIVVILVLIVALPLVGGRSAIGLSATEPIFIILILLSAFQLRMQYKRALEQIAKQKELEQQKKIK